MNSIDEKVLRSLTDPLFGATLTGAPIATLAPGQTVAGAYSATYAGFTI